MKGAAEPRLDRFAHQLQAVTLAQAIVDQIDVVPGLGDRRERVAPGLHPVEHDGAAKDLREQIAGQQVVVLVVLDQQDARREIARGGHGFKRGPFGIA